VKVLIAFLLAMLCIVSLGFGLWDGRFSQRDRALRAIHYDTQYDLSAQRRAPVEQRR
jgi:hypothetical protein